VKEIDNPELAALAAALPRKADLPYAARPLQDVAGCGIGGQKGNNLPAFFIIHEPLGIAQEGGRFDDGHGNGLHARNVVHWLTHVNGH